MTSNCALDTKFAGVVGAAGGGGAGSQPVITPNAANPNATIANLPFIPIAAKVSGRTDNGLVNIELASSLGDRAICLVAVLAGRLGLLAASNSSADYPPFQASNKAQSCVRIKPTPTLNGVHILGRSSI